MPRVLGYVDPLSVAPGEEIRFMIGTLDGPRRYRAEVVRLVCGDTRPDALRTVHLPTSIDGEHEGAPQPIDAGSYVIVERPEAFDALSRFTLQVFIQPTRVPMRPSPRRQVVMGTWAEDRGDGIALMLDEDGALALLVGRALVTTGVPLTARRWYHVAASVDLPAGTVTLRQTPLADHAPSLEQPAAVTAAIRASPSPPGDFFLGAARLGIEDGRRRTTWHFNGKIDRPTLARRALSAAELLAAATTRTTAGAAEDAIGLWDLAADIATDRVTDRSPNHLHGRTVNAPKRAVTGHNWDGRAMDWRQAPAQYGAIHFHDDDLYDAGWRPSLTTTIPADARNGVYALRLATDDAPDFWAVFYVRPARRGPRAGVAFLASTATYLCYSNYRARMRPGPAELYIGALPVVDTTDLVLMHHPELGGSTYDTHADGSGVCHVSRRRPIVNTRPTGRLWNLLLDLCLLDWLEGQQQQPYDVITDDDLHAEGLPLLEGYAVVLTGCHPEYSSREMLDALAAYLGRGGRIMYMGGNGFYWRVSFPAAHPGMIEMRRAEDGTRAWVESVGEYYHSSTGEYGGLWRRQDRPPNALVGVGFVAQGFDRSSYYRRTPASRDPRARFIFEGIEDEVLGDFGLSGDGAAGLELDAFNPALGSPPWALVVATSENHSNAFQLVNEEMNVSFAGADGQFSPAVRADMVFYEHPGGGAVFSTGSIAYVGSLAHERYTNNISRLTLNVLRRFLDPVPFTTP